MKLNGAVLFPLFAAALLSSPAGAAGKGDPQRGEKVFAKATCASCHPAGGNVLKPGDQLKGPKFAREFSDDGKIAQVVRDGIKGSAMPAFDQKRLPDQDLQDIIAYLRTLTPRPGK